MLLKKKKKMEEEFIDTITDKICAFINPNVFQEYKKQQEGFENSYNPFILDTLNKINNNISPELASKIIGDLDE